MGSISQKRDLSSSNPRKSLNINNINPHVKEAQYAVRGELAVKSEKYKVQLANGDKLPFDTVISANIGNPQQLDQKPITFFRQVASLMENPLLLEHPDVLTGALGYKQDVVDRAKRLLKDVKSVGAYSQSHGAPGIRQSVADFIERRDGYPSDKDSVYLSNGASSGVNTLMHIICSGPQTGILVPIPQYPLYTATLALLNAQCVPYYLEESKSWGTNIDAIKESLAKAKKDGTDVKAIVVINPGNPTGASLKPEDIKSVLEFAAENQLVVLADEVYQTNVFEGEFVSFKKGLRDLQKSEANKDGKFDALELASLHSISKGMIGECGHRGGYFELVGFDEEVSPVNCQSVDAKYADIMSRLSHKSTSSSPSSSAHPSLDNAWSRWQSIHPSLASHRTTSTSRSTIPSLPACRSVPMRSTTLSRRWKEYLVNRHKDPCTSSPPLAYQKRLKRQPRTRVRSPTTIIA